MRPRSDRSRERPDEKELLESALRFVGDRAGELGGAAASAATRALRAAADRAGRCEFRRRARVVVLFADLAGFTPFSESTDAEEVSGFVGGLWDLLDHVAHAKGGRVLQHFGDAVLVVWGDEASSEDDAARALSCAAEMLAAVDGYLRSRLGAVPAGAAAPAGLRIGIHAGAAFAGPIGAVGEYAVLGDTVNAASRLQSAASPGEAVVSEALLRLVEEPPELRELGRLNLKGKRDPVRAFALAAPAGTKKGATPRPQPRRDRNLASARDLVGRRSELERLRRLHEECVASRRARTVWLSGEAGIGKSRLAAEFIRSLPLDSACLSAFGSRAENSPYGYLRSMLEARAGILDTDGEETARGKLAARAELVGLDETAAGKLAAILGYGSRSAAGAGSRGRTPSCAEPLAAYLRAEAGGGSLALILDDLPWADAASLAAIDAALGLAADQPIFTLRVARAGAEPCASGDSIALGAMTRDEAVSLAADCLAGLSPLPEELGETIASRAGGNPLYVIEFVGYLRDSLVVDARGERWTYDPRRLAQTSAPPTLTDLMQARLDALDEPEARLLEAASVFGGAFWLSALVPRSPTGRAAPSAAPRRRLESLARRGLVERRSASTVAGAEEWAFASDLLREAVYDRILLSERPALHERAARWLLDHLGGSAVREAEKIARHFELARRERDAAGLLAAAADRAERAGDAPEAARLYAKALGSGGLPPPAASRIQACLDRLVL